MSLLAAGFLLGQSALSRPVSFDEPAMPLARLLPALGSSMGVELVASATVAKDVALVRAKNRPLGEVLKRLAEQDGAELETTKTGYRIVRTAASERKERAAALARRIASIAPGLEATRRSLAFPATVATYRAALPLHRAVHERGGGWSRSGTPSTSAPPPASRAAMRALLKLSSETLASLREGDRIVYSNLPTRLQAKMTFDDVFQSFEREQNAWADANAKVEKIEPSQYEDDPFRRTERLDAPPMRAVLIVSRGNSADAAVARIVLLDAQGEELGTASYGLQAQEDVKALGRLPAKDASRPVPMSPETKTLLEGVPNLRGVGAETATPAAIALLSEPEKRDPLSFGATDLLRDIGGDGSIVAVLPDVAWLTGFVGEKNEVSRDDQAFLETALEIRREPGWTIARPRDPFAARFERVDRAALGRFVRAIVAAKRVPLDDYAAYAWNASDAPSDKVGVFAAMMIARPLFNPDVDWRMLRLFGSLTAFERGRMLTGGQKDWRTLSPRQRDLAAYVATHRPMSVSAPTRVGSHTLMMEPTEVFAEGYEGLTITLRSSTDAPLLCDSTQDPAARQWRRILDAESAGRTMALKDGPRFDRFGVARRTTYALGVSAKRGVSAEASLEDVTPPAKPLVALGDLPANIREAIERGRAANSSQG